MNPYSTEEIAEAMHQALQVPTSERQKRMQKLREAVAGNNIYRWAGKIVSALLKFEFQEPAASPAEATA